MRLGWLAPAAFFFETFAEELLQNLFRRGFARILADKATNFGTQNPWGRKSFCFGTCFRVTSTENMRSAQHLHRCRGIFVLFSLRAVAQFSLAWGSPVGRGNEKLTSFCISFFVRLRHN
jgi:hypothetical protein